MLNSSRYLSVCLYCVSLIAPGFAEGQQQRVRFDRDIRPILSENCFQCHGPDKENLQANLRLDSQAQLYARRETGPVVVPGDPEKSQLWLRVSSHDADQVMPPPDSTRQLNTKQIDLLRRWIAQGAQWSGHWAFEVPTRPVVPRTVPTDWPSNEIDHFVLATLMQNGLRPSPQADRYTLARRVSLDLTGLTPSPVEVKAFVNDETETAYERFVDKLLASRHFGERMAVAWLDAARYGDTSVFHADGPRQMWAWRDWVVRAYNANKSFAEFSIEQLAGDLLADSTTEQRIATGFSRNNATTDEGGLIAEEYRVEYVIDRVRTMSMVWLGLSLECAQCHDHKYDPFTMTDYYQVFAYFNQSADPGSQTRNGNQAPIELYFDPARIRQADQLRTGLETLFKQQQDRGQAAEAAFKSWLVRAVADPQGAEIDPQPIDAIIHLQLDEGQGKTVADAAQKDRKGKIQGSELWSEGKQGKAFKTDGNGYIEMGDIVNFDRLDTFSFGSWIKPAGEGGGAPLGKMDESQNNRGFMIDSSARKLQVMLAHEWPLNSIMIETGPVLQADQWQHVFVTYDGSSQASGVKVYIDGRPQEVKVVADCLTSSIQNRQPLLIGRRYLGGNGSPFKGLLDDVRLFSRTLSASEVEALAGQDPITPLLAIDDLSDAQRTILRDYFLVRHDQEYQALAQKLQQQKDRIASLTRPASTVMVMQDAVAMRDTFILARGQYDQPTETKVLPKPLAMLAQQSETSPTNRLGLARWLFQDTHPLTARVSVNRYWAMLFGTGLVATLEDFGSQGAYPSHRELLDWLAVEFRESGWDIKRMLKLIVMSATYRQSSSVIPGGMERDPDNRLLARGPRFRLQAEFIRDNALAVSGLLVPGQGGPGGRVYQPPGLWAEVGLGGVPKFVQDHGKALYRRSLYTYWKRSSPPPNMQIFDAPTREKCILQRSRTNTPLQALVLLNDVQFVEASRSLAEQLLQGAPRSDLQRFQDLYLRVLTRPVRNQEVEVLQDVLADALNRFKSDSTSARELLGFGESKRDESLDVATHAAWTLLCNVVFNLAETLTRN